MEPHITGLHHVTAVTGNARQNLDFYTRILGMRLVKKTVNQDDVSAYHLFYADALGSPGTDLTFFDWPHSPPAAQGAGAVTETALRIVGGPESLNQWLAWFDQENITHGEIEPAGENEFASLSFQDREGQHLRLIAEPRTEGSAADFHPWSASPVPLEAAIVGLSRVTLTVRQIEPTARVLTDLLGFRRSANDPSLFEVGMGGPGAQLHIVTSSSYGSPGAGGVHHVAWSVRDVDEQIAIQQRLTRAGLGTSGLIDRFYFHSIYFRIPGGILFEIATEGPGFAADEDPARLGERLSLPPFLEPRRAQIEAGLDPLF